MKNIITILLLITLPLISPAQQVEVLDLTYNMSISLPEYSGSLKSSDIPNIVVNNFSESKNTVHIDTSMSSISISRMSDKTGIVESYELTIMSVSQIDGHGITYNVHDSYNGNYGFLFLEDDGMVIFTLQEIYSFDNYNGFIAFRPDYK